MFIIINNSRMNLYYVISWNENSN